MTSSVDLDLILRHHKGTRCRAELRFDAPGSAAVIDTSSTRISLTFDSARLAALALDPDAYGLELGKMLLKSKLLSQNFIKARTLAQQERLPLRLRLAIDTSAEELHALHWEMLRDPLTPPHASLTASEQVLFSRYLGSTEPEPARARAHRQLRVLVLIAAPADLNDYGLTPIDAAQEIDLIRGALNSASITVVGNDGLASLEELLGHLREDYDVVYLMAHGRIDAEGETWLYLEDKQRQVNPVSGVDFLKGIASLALRPRLIILAACDSAGDGNRASAQVALGPRLVRQGVPAVLAMQGKVTLETLQGFFPIFFATLQHDGQIDRAVAIARRSVRQRPDFWKPTLFLRLKHGRLWEQVDATGKPSLGANPPVNVPPPARPPEPLGFVGRAAEIEAVKSLLDQQHLVIISGMSGVGKTMLMATVARQLAPPDRLFWHTFSADENLTNLIQALADMLAHHGQPGLWEMLWQARQPGGQIPPLDVQVDYLSHLLARQGYLLCLDRAEVLDNDPRVEVLMNRLRPELVRADLRVMMTVREKPKFALEHDLKRLEGLNLDDTHLLIQARAPTFDPDWVTTIYTQTKGYALWLIMAINALQSRAYPEQLLNDLSTAPDIEGFLFDEVDDQLSTNEREVMLALAILLDEGGTRYAIEAVVSGGSVRRVLRRLCDRSLLFTEEDGNLGLVYRQHSLVQTFYYSESELLESTHQQLHRRAAAYYENEERDLLRAAIHYERGGNPRYAADLVTGNLDTLLSLGRVQALRVLLERLANQILDEAHWIAVTLALGRVLLLTQPGDQAQACFQAVLDRLEAQPDTSDVRLLRARTCCWLGMLSETQQPSEAIKWFEHGLVWLGDIETHERATLNLYLGGVLIAIGESEAAMTVLEEALVQLAPHVYEPRANAQMNLGVLAGQQGELEQAEQYFQQALDGFQRSGSRWREVAVRQNLALLRSFAGDWDGAMTLYREALQQARTLGLLYDQLSLSNNIGWLLIGQGHLTEAQTVLSTALERAVSQELQDNVVYLRVNLADLAIRQECWNDAALLLDQAVEQAESLKLRDQESEIACLYALIHVAQGDLVRALESVEQALAIAENIGYTRAEGIALRIRGQVLLAEGRAQEALEVWAASSVALESDIYEHARTQLLWGAALAAHDPAAGRALLEQARNVFEGLGAKHDLALARKLLGDMPTEGSDSEIS